MPTRESQPSTGDTANYPFRPWVRRVCTTAMVWGIGVLVVLSAVVWVLRDPNEGYVGKAFTVLAGYAVLFLASLLKIWWTAGRPAVILDAEGIGHQPLHTFSPKRIEYAQILACGPREGTESQRFVFERRGGRAKEFFLNLAVVKGKHQLLAHLGEKLVADGLEADGNGWKRPAYSEAPDAT
ncbi:MAG: hypothetical protein VYE73_03450 [Acidobacteriota bacterium]|nr:hypothetical protein [Acidobacteriota bacterium]